MNIWAIADIYGIKPVNIYKCKYYYVISSVKGSYMLSSARPSKEKIEKIDRFKRAVEDNGFFALDSYIPALDGKPYGEYEGEVFTLTKYFGDNELNINSDIQVSAALETIGRLHSAVRGATEAAKGDMLYAASAENTLIRGYEKQANSLNKLKKNISGHYKNEFDTAVSKYIAPVAEKAQRELNNLARLGYGSKMTYCHSSLKEGNIIYNRGRCHIIDWDNMKNAHFLEDSAFFIKRYMRKALYYNRGNMGIDELYSKYSRFNKLSKNEEDCFYALVKYPHRFAGLLLEYYKKNRGFVPSGLRYKLEEAMEQWEWDSI